MEEDCFPWLTPDHLTIGASDLGGLGYAERDAEHSKVDDSTGPLAVGHSS